MTLTLLYFAAIRDLVGGGEEQLAAPDAVHQVRELLIHLEELHPALKGRLGSVRVAVNESFVSDSERLAEGDVVALIPPVCGG